MARKPIPEATQTAIFLSSRRRCCLCFWLKGEDEVKKGQIAHLDGDNEDSSENNLVFLCLEHHDEYDSTPRLSKGLREKEVRRWRDELYKEMRYRFRSIKAKAAALLFAGFRWEGPQNEYSVRFKVRNTGEVELRGIVMAIRLPDDVSGETPQHYEPVGPSGLPGLLVASSDPWAASEDRQDFFEPNGRVCIKSFGPHAVLMPEHTVEFDTLLFNLATTRPGDNLELEYRIDAEDMQPIRGTLHVAIPTDPNEMLKDNFEE
jgi:hypothetical protein